MDENNLFLKKIEERFDRFLSSYTITGCDFLSPEEQSSASGFFRRNASQGAFLYGGYDEAERRMPVFMPDYTGVTDTIRHFAGFEMAAAIGAMLHAAEEKMIVLVDGFIMTACMLAASQMDAAVKDYAVFGHQGDEGGHKLMLDAMGAEPLLHLDMRLGEGTGALCAYPIVVSAVKMFNEMDNFSHANITKYF